MEQKNRLYILIVILILALLLAVAFVLKEGRVEDSSPAPVQTEEERAAALMKEVRAESTISSENEGEYEETMEELTSEGNGGASESNKELMGELQTESRLR